MQQLQVVGCLCGLRKMAFRWWRLLVLVAGAAGQDLFLAAAPKNVPPTQDVVHHAADQFRSRWSSIRKEAVADAAHGAAQGDVPSHCKLAIIGAGWAGAYFAWRIAVDTNLMSPSDVCVFEADARVGGRIFSVHDLPGFEDLVVDAGGYRFPETDMLPADLVWKALRMPTACYNWKCAKHCLSHTPGNCYVVKDAYGNNAGYAKPIETMLGQLEEAGEGTQVFFGRRLIGLSGMSSPRHVALHLATGEDVYAEQVLLNMPRNAVRQLDPNSVLFSDEAPKLKFDMMNITSQYASKVYAYYRDAWWNSKLGIMDGEFRDDAYPAPLHGRYHDGPQKCLVGHDPSGAPVYSGDKVQFGNCTGALLVFYDDVDALQYYRQFMTDSQKPLSLISYGSQQGKKIIQTVHKHLMEYHASALQKIGVAPSELAPPEYLVISNWIPEAKLLPSYGLNYLSNKVRAQMRTPTPNFNIFMSNVDYGYSRDAKDPWPWGWASDSLIMAEKLLQAEFNMSRPVWLNDSWYSDHVLAVP